MVQVKPIDRKKLRPVHKSQAKPTKPKVKIEKSFIDHFWTDKYRNETYDGCICICYHGTFYFIDFFFHFFKFILILIIYKILNLYSEVGVIRHWK